MAEAHGKGILKITTESFDDTVYIWFSDDGPGIPQDNMSRIFQPFFTTKEVGKGTGLGLSICHGIITEHNGRIWAENKPGGGATFNIELPAYRVKQNKSIT
jgi:signal transduction histidine kinase